MLLEKKRIKEKCSESSRKSVREDREKGKVWRRKKEEKRKEKKHVDDREKERKNKI